MKSTIYVYKRKDTSEYETRDELFYFSVVGPTILVELKKNSIHLLLVTGIGLFALRG